MRIDNQNAGAMLQALQPETQVAQVQEKVQLSMLKKTLDMEKENAATLMNMLGGKGQVIDIRA
ncbi:MAG: putative motility protein [Armatimonadetes bacterium]|nr:putative motility protein [Armatimonadota bacterium]